MRLHNLKLENKIRLIYIGNRVYLIETGIIYENK